VFSDFENHKQRGYSSPALVKEERKSEYTKIEKRNEDPIVAVVHFPDLPTQENMMSREYALPRQVLSLFQGGGIC
jgi:hypothetical protein